MCLHPQNVLFNNKPKKLIYTITNETPEFAFEMAKTIPLSPDFGAIKIEINEFVSFFKSKNNYEEKFLTNILLNFDGDYEKRNIKSEDSEETITDVNTNLVTYSDFSNLTGQTKSDFLSWVSSGALRRSMISFSDKSTKEFVKRTNEEARKINQNLEIIGNELFNIFEQIEPNTHFVVSDEAYEIHQDYLSEIYNYCNSIEDDLLKLEIESRAFKALRLSAIYAALNHPKQFNVTEEDMLQAIDVVEFLSQDFAKFLRYKPNVDDYHDKIYKFLKNNLGQEFTKGGFTSRASEFNIGRDKLAKNFKITMETVADIAEQDGYFLQIKENLRKNGFKYKLLKIEDVQLSECIQDFDSLIEIEHSKDDNSIKSSEVNNNDNLTNITNPPQQKVINPFMGV